MLTSIYLISNFKPIAANHDALHEVERLTVYEELKFAIARFSILLLATSIPERDHAAMIEMVVVLQLERDYLSALRSLTAEIIVGVLCDETSARGNPTLTVDVSAFTSGQISVSHVDGLAKVLEATLELVVLVREPSLV